VGEYRIALARVREMDELRCTVEAPADIAERVADAIHRELGVRCVVEAVTPGTLPRFEMKAKRFNKTNV
jgi:phenylacetate-CoA ligase